MQKDLLFRKYAEKLYLVESDEKLLVVSRNGVRIDAQKDFTYGTYLFQVFEVDLETNTSVEIKDLGSRALFVGDNSSFSMEALNDSVLKPNCIYFTDDCVCSYLDITERAHEIGVTWYRFHPTKVGKDMGVYNLLDGTITPFIEPGFRHFDPTSPHMWVEKS